MTQEFEIFDWQAIARKLWKKRLFFCIFFPAVAILIWGATFLVPKQYENTIKLHPERQLADGNRIQTLSRPETYDLGILPTENAMRKDMIGEIINARAFQAKLLGTPVRTSDDSFVGTYMEYLCTQHKKMLHGPRFEQAEYSPVDPLHPTGQQLYALSLAHDQIHATYDEKMSLATITVRAQDPLVSTLVAQAIIDSLDMYSIAYQKEKDMLMLHHLEQLVSEAKADWQATPDSEREEKAMKKEAYESFYRQMLVFRGQITEQPLVAAVSAPINTHSRAGISPIFLALALSMMLTMLAAIWIVRDEILR